MSDARDTEIAELQARLAILEATGDPLRPSKPSRKRASVGPLMLTITGVFVAVWGFAAINAPEPPPVVPTPPVPAAGFVPGALYDKMRREPPPETAKRPRTLCDRARSARVINRFRSNGLVRGDDVTAVGLTLVVRRGQWEDMLVDHQRELIAAYDCMLAGNGGHLSAVRVRHTVRGDDSDYFNAGHLLDLRRQGWAASDD